MDAATLDQYEKTLADQQFLGGQQPTSADREAYDKLKSTTPSVESHPNTYAWFVLVNRFTDAVRASWAGAQAAPAKGAKPAAKEAPKEAKKAEDDDDMGLFDDAEPTAEEKAALEAQKAAAASKAKKAAPIAKSLILFEVKPYEAETDLDELAKKILAISMDGLQWKTEYKKEPIAYGVFKLILGVVVEDEKVGVDDLQEQIEAFEDEVQSVDILSFNKL